MHRAELGRKPTIIAAGFFALDVVFGLDDPAPKFYAGGTSGNIVAGLSYMGWEALPLGRLSDDVAGDFVRKDLKRWGVDTQFLGLSPVAASPIVLEKIELSKNGVPKHRFLWNCPDCNGYFPPFKPVLQSSVEFLKSEKKDADVFFADRVSRSTVELARYYGSKGTLIYFEPSAAGDAKLFREMLQLCDVLKYSTQRARSFSELLRDHKAHLEIETLGEDGLRFRTRHSFGVWNSVPAFEIKIKDTAGSGDWTSVGLIESMFRDGREDLAGTSREDISSFLEHAQALAALNCQFEGARGAMYQMSRPRFMDAVASLESKRPEKRRQRKITLACLSPTFSVCPRCRPNKLLPQPEQSKNRAVLQR